MTRTRALRPVTLLSLCLATACGGGSGSSPTTPSAPAPPPNTTTFQGTIAGSSGDQTGTLTVTVQGQVASARPWLWLPFISTLHAQSVSASGSVHVSGGSTTSLTGTFDTATRALTLSGGGFSFTGSANAGVITGTYASPSGATGAFSSRSTAGGTVTVYCGDAIGAGGGIRGAFNIVVSEASGAVSGAFSQWFDNPPTLGTITGQATGGALSLVFTATAGQYAGESGTGTGTIQGGSVSGTAPAGSGGAGRFSGSTSRCQ